MPLLLAGCMSQAQRMAARDAREDRTCQSYSAKPGTDAYIACRLTLNQQREIADQRERCHYRNLMVAGIDMASGSTSAREVCF
jgi:hypothetical protein